MIGFKIIGVVNYVYHLHDVVPCSGLWGKLNKTSTFITQRIIKKQVKSPVIE